MMKFAREVPRRGRRQRLLTVRRRPARARAFAEGEAVLSPDDFSRGSLRFNRDVRRMTSDIQPRKIMSLTAEGSFLSGFQRGKDSVRLNGKGY